MRPERSYATCDRWSTNPSPSTCIGGAVPCTGLQVLDPVKKDTPTCNKGLYFISEKEHKKQNSQQVGRNASPTKYSGESI